ncbi:MAG TPA: 2-dehydro-3-deoxygalactonokinase [Dongiaceae bacterium]|nr:2-dehydro-3-deoxygalactonokinase [Dongiaceae bacterium]
MSFRCIAVDWGTSNRRAWALGPDGEILQQRADDKGLLAHPDRRFADSLESFLADWLKAAPGIPIVMAGMVGSRMGWVEVPYVPVPVRLTDLADHLMKAGEIVGSACWIVPGVNMDDAIQPEVMRGEECQMLGALLQGEAQSTIFVTPGTHSKWARVVDGRLISFRTYITGELFDLLCKSGTLSQVMIGSQDNADAFARGVAASADAELLNRVFSVRTFGLFGKMPAADLRSYLSGLLVGTEMRDALAAWPDAGRAAVTCVGSKAMIARYQVTAHKLGLELRGVDNDAILPPALHWIVRKVSI